MNGAGTANPWSLRNRRMVYENAWIRVWEDAVIRPDGEPGIYGVVEFRNRAVGVIACEGDQIYLVGQFRYPLNQYSWEIPEGGCPVGEEPLAAAQRELREETGLSAETWQLMGKSHLSNSVSDELAFWYLATGLTQGEHEPDVTEDLAIRKVSVGKAIEMVQNGEITDAISMLAIMQFALHAKPVIRQKKGLSQSGQGPED